MMFIENEHYMDYPKSPSHTTLANWVYKVGYHELTRAKARADDWVILLDHSIQMSSSKVLVIYGIRLCDYDFSRALVYTDLSPLRIKVRTSWTGEDIKEELVSLQHEIGGIRYAVADYGANLRKGLELAGITHVHDLSHKIALLLEKRYQNDPVMKEFNTRLSAMRSKLSQSDLAHLVPVAARKKSFYQNIGTTARWAIKILHALSGQELTAKEEQALAWLLDYKNLILELNELDQVICQVEKLLKNNGVNKKISLAVNRLIKEAEKNLTKQGKDILRAISFYCQDCMECISQKDKIICSSDIIESAFGKYKLFSSDNKMACVTKMVLSLAAITVKPTVEMTKEIMENVKLAQVELWDKENIGQTTFKRRLKLMSVVA